VLGTQVVARAALEAGVKSFVLISTDKAVRPSSVMGATKRWAELIVLDCARWAGATGSGQKFSMVRFGNVLGSNGSVVPLFREQIAAGGPITLTDVSMSRYFMSIHEAAELIVQAGALSEGGDLFLLDMGEPILIRDLAENMIRLTGLVPKWSPEAAGDIEIRVVGARPGEKLTEELFYDRSKVEHTRQRKILRAPRLRPRAVDTALAELMAALATEDEQTVRQVLFSWLETWAQPAPAEREDAAAPALEEAAPQPLARPG
jgi:FlaA1/EpsC-like NDP-sugar epimerase